MDAKILLFVVFATIEAQVVVHPKCRGVIAGQKFVANPRGCNWFIYCEDPSEPVEGKCPYDLHFDVQIQGCAYPDLVFPRCTFDEDLIARTHFECPTNRDMRIIPHPFDCEYYTICWQGQKRDMKCPDDRPHFSIFDMECTTELLADCKAVDRFCNGKDLTQFIENPHSCDDYVLCTECQNKFEVLKWSCPSDFKFDITSKICLQEVPGFVCHVRILDDRDVPPEPFSIDCPLGSPFRVPHPKECQYYFFCTPSGSILDKCREGELFDIDEERCVPASLANCNSTTTSPEQKRIERKFTNVAPRIFS